VGFKILWIFHVRSEVEYLKTPNSLDNCRQSAVPRAVILCAWRRKAFQLVCVQWEVTETELLLRWLQQKEHTFATRKRPFLGSRYVSFPVKCATSDMPDYKPLLRQNTFTFPEAVPSCTLSVPKNCRHACCHSWQTLPPRHSDIFDCLWF